MSDPYEDVKEGRTIDSVLNDLAQARAQLFQAEARLLALAQARDALHTALTGMTEHYVRLVACGDCGNWDAETEAEVIAARAALSTPREP